MKIQGVRLQGTKLVPSGAAVVDSDTYFNLVSLLLPGNGTNGQTNNTFLDSSTNAFTITRNGNTTQGTFSPFSQTGWSNYFDGTGDYLQLADSTSWDLTGDFTIEMWIYKLSSSSQTFFLVGTAGSSTSILLYQNASNAIIFNTSSAVITSSTSAALNQWNHIALVRNGSGSNNITLYLNGLNVGQATNTTSFTGDASNGVRIGAEYPTGFEFLGYMSNVRIVKGTAVYTSNFTPSTSPLTAIANTQLLTCQSNRFIDNSTNAFAITVNGNTAVQAFAPFDPTSAYSAGTVGGSGYFDGTGDYLTTPSNAAFNLGTGDFTIETWIYLTTAINNSTLTTILGYGTTLESNGYIIDSGSATSGGFRLVNLTSPYPQVDTLSIQLNTWTHIAFCRSGATLRSFVNGVQNGSISISANYSPTNSPTLTIAQHSQIIAGREFPGYISNLRLVKGTALYTANFTVPTAPLTAITNTSLLLNYTNGGITDAAAKNVLETAGDAAISTAQSKWGGSSMAFDGNGDYLAVGSLAQPLPNLKLGYEDFTLEFWVYFNQVSSRAAIINSGWNSTGFDTEGGITLDIGATSGRISLAVGTISPTTFAATTTGSFITNTWYHLALVRNGTNLRLYANGSYNDGFELTLSSATLKVLNMGWYRVGAYDNNTFYFNGYINDLRITRGLARYTANFTAPTTAFPTQ